MKLRDLSIVRKLGLLLAFNTAIAVIAIALVFSVGTAVTRYQSAQEQLMAMADVIGENSRAALAFSDPESARKILLSLRNKLEIESARLTDSAGDEFAAASFSYEKGATPSPLEGATHFLFPDKLTVSNRIQDGNNTVGRIELTAHLSNIWLDLMESLALMVLLAIALSALAVFFGLRMRRIVTDPILSLANVSHRVSRERDYSLRAKKTGNDEIGALVDDFNRMLSEIETRDEALRQERESLEVRVEQRTADLKLAMEAAERANKVKSEFLSTVSHELRTPLTAIAGSIGLVSGGALGELPEQIAQMLQIAHKNSQRLTFLINDLLDMEKLMAGKLHFDMLGQPLTPLVEQALADNQAYAEQFGVTYKLIESAEGVLVEVDAQRLHQVLANLLSNAAKFSPPGAQVEVSVHQHKSRVRVDVRDHGAGIPAEFHARIFQKFSQADASDTRQKGGTGLGLAITRELIERMGGQVGFESMPDQGTCFFFELPLWNEQASRPAALLPSVQTSDETRILVVEDDPDVARLLSFMLTRAGYEVDTVETGAEALAQAQRTSYVAMTLDLMLPDMNGVQVIELLRAHPATAQLPIVVIAARMEEGRLAVGPNVAGLAWLSKPIDLSQLLTSLQQLTSPGSAAYPRVLHVEDDESMHQRVRSMAGGRFDFELATTLREARARVSLERFDVVILDLTLPNESGWDLLPEIRANQPDARVVILSGSTLAPDDAQRVDAVLQKSEVSPRKLLDAIGRRAPRGAQAEVAP
jgi:signal transduction histidine kinase/DNA-binding response OmpR family regulator